MKILEADNLCKNYGKGSTLVKAIDNVSFTVDEGDFVAIVGSSGSGKSTLLHILGAVDKPTSGKVIVGGTDVFKQKDDALAVFRRRKVGLIYQFYNLIPILNVEENMTLPILLDGRKVDKDYLKEILTDKVIYDNPDNCCGFCNPEIYHDDTMLFSGITEDKFYSWY